MTIFSKITGTGSYLPAKKVSNQELADQLAKKGIETSDEWIVSRSGISSRHYADDGEKSSDMGVKAAKKALEAAKLAPAASSEKATSAACGRRQRNGRDARGVEEVRGMSSPFGNQGVSTAGASCGGGCLV